MRDLDLVADFYEMLAYTAFQFLARTRRPAGLDSAFFDSLAGTVASMKALLLKGHIGDAYTLLRRFREVGWLQAYVMLRLEDNSVFDQLLLEGGQALDQEGFVRLVERAMQKGIYVEEIEKWMSGEESLPELRKFHEHIVRSPLVEQLNFLFDNGYEEIHNRCNDHVHLNFFAFSGPISPVLNLTRRWSNWINLRQTSVTFLSVIWPTQSASSRCT